MRDFVLEKQNCDTRDKKCYTNDAAFLEFFLLNCIFVQNIGSVVGRSFLKVNNVLPFWSFCGKPYFASCDKNDQNCCFFSL